MQNNNLLILSGLAMLGLHTSACQRGAVKDETEHPAKVERIEGSDLHRVILTEKAILRIGLKTDVVREVEVTPTRTFWGEVVPSAAAPAAEGPPKGWVRVRLLANELLTLAREVPARIFDRDDDDDDDGVTAQAVKEEDDDGEDEGRDNDRDDEKSPAGYRAPAAGERQILAARLKHAARKQVKGKQVYYAVEGESRGWVPEQRVRVKLPLSGGGTKRRIVPYSSLIYDSHGQTWIYTSPEPRTFIRQKVEVDYVLGNRAILSEGPPAGTVVASVGAAELYGTEFKVGH
jgi:hypothetical protein